MSKRETPSWIKRIIVVVLFLLFLGVLLDAYTGFSLIRQSSSILGGIGTLLILGVLYLFGEGVGELVSGIDKVDQPLWRRTLNLVVLLSAVALVCGVFYYAFRFIQI